MNILPRDSIFDLDRFFNHFLTPEVQAENSNAFFSPRIDITEHDDHYKIAAELAGVKKDDLSVTLEDGVLTIQASMASESSEEKEGKVIRKERRTGSYMRSFTVGNAVTESDINAKFENGLLELSIPKSQPEQPVSRQIEVH